MVALGQVAHGAAIVRPPGHHAESNMAMGFWYVVELHGLCRLHTGACLSAHRRRGGQLWKQWVVRSKGVEKQGNGMFGAACQSKQAGQSGRTDADVVK